MNKSSKIAILSIGILLILLTMPELIFYTEKHSFINLLYSLLVPLAVFSIPLFIFRKVVRW